MIMSSRKSLLTAAALLLGPIAAFGSPSAGAAPAAQYKHPTQRKVNNKPLPAGVKAASAMAPFMAGDCGICHQSKDPKNPGPAKKAGSALCYACHDEFQEIMERPYKHPPAVVSCTNCHNPHDSAQKKLLHEEQSAQCFDCHGEI